MDVGALTSSRPAASELLLVHCAALDPDHERPTALHRLEEELGEDLARRLVFALSR